MALVTAAEVRRVAAIRQSQFARWPNYRHWSEDLHVMGLSGEVAFAEAFGLTPDLSTTARRDEGFDFMFGDATTVDVKTARGPRALVVPSDKTNWAEIFVLAAWLPNSDELAALIGWADADVFRGRRPVAQRYNHAYVVPRADLKPMNALLLEYAA